MLTTTTSAALLALVWLAPADDEFFSRSVAPILERRCVQCHRSGKAEGGLALDTAQGTATGGESGPVVVPGNIAESGLLDQVSGEKPDMPKAGPPLRPEEIALLREWIQRGALWPEGRTLRDRSEPDQDWWSLRPLIAPPVPALDAERQARVRTPVDAFVQAKLREVGGLALSPEADRRTLIRRLSFDLLGLPPTIEEVESFVRDPATDAYEKLVDRLLDSPHYGERWARHWLDVVHYGDTHGYDKDKLRLNAWPYRDYVIRAFNEDRPYARFIQEQLAGDVLWPDTIDGQVATGFISAGPWDFIGHAEVPETKIDGKVARHLDRDDMVVTTMNTFLSLTGQCAQCHNHKFDPMTQEHYYGLQSVFAALDRADRPYEPDPRVGQRRRELRGQQAVIREQQQKLDADLKSRAGMSLEVLDRQLAELQQQQQTKEGRPEYGYHSQIESTPDRTKWVQVDLGAATAIERLAFVGCWDAFNNLFHGFGFPVRYRIEVSSDPEFKLSEVVVDRTATDEPNPGTKPQVVNVGKTARFVRMTATKLAPRQNDFIFALGELQVLDARGVNVAFGKEVTALDSIEAPVRWAKRNVVDGYYYGIQADPAVAEAILRLRGERDKVIAQVTSPAERERIDTLKVDNQRVADELAKQPPAGTVFCGCVHTGNGTFVGTGGNGGKPREIRVLIRGNVQTPTELVASPGALPIIPGLDWRFPLPADHREGDRRVALAKWIADSRNPLTWRSIVNRVWLYHFGHGIVDSPNDFGRMGQPPSHPELLDWLAVQFRDGRQSFKDLHRLIVNSSTYRQVSSLSTGGPATGPAGADIARAVEVDAENRLLWRMNRRKLEAEAVRDSVLWVAGKLRPDMYGPAFQDFVIEKPEHSPHYEYGKFNPDDPATHRRSIYRFLVRSQPQPFMNTLDCADPSQLVDKRNETLTALQALALLNNQFMVRMSQRFAERLEQTGSDLPSQLQAAYRLALAREPTSEEAAELVEYARKFGLPNACRVIFNLNEFVFVD